MSDNSTNGPPIKKLGSVDVFLVISAVIISILAITCNTLLIFVIVRSRLLKTPTNIFIASLAVGELFIGVFGIPFAAASIVAKNWPLSLSACEMSASLQIIGRFSSTYSLMAVCIDRCVAVSRPLKYSQILTLKSASFMLAFVWILAVIVGFLPLGSYGFYKYSSAYFLCMFYKSHDGNEHLVKEIICIYLPAFVICLTILQIVKEVKSHHRIFAIVQLPAPSASGRPGELLPAFIPGPRGFNRNTSKAMRSLFVVTCGYAMFCLPVSVLNILYQDGQPGTISDSAITSIVWLSFLCCVIIPIIIIMFNRKFRAQVRLILKPRLCPSKKPSKDVFTISTGLHNILDATLVLNMIKHENASTTASTRRQIFRLAFQKANTINV